MRRIINYILVAITTLGFIGCGNGGKHVARQMEFDFFGICSSTVACIYFMQENGKFYINYEAMGADLFLYNIFIAIW